MQRFTIAFLASILLAVGPHSALLAKSETQPSSAQSKAGSKAQKNSHSPGMLVPPPPPTLPIAGQLSGFTGVPIELLSEADLKRRQKELADELAAGKKEIEDKEKNADEKRQRSTLFASLYTEGVVSRRELEQSQREDSQAQAELKSARQKIEDLEHIQSEVATCLKKIAKRPASRASKTSRSADEKPSSKK